MKTVNYKRQEIKHFTNNSFQKNDSCKHTNSKNKQVPLNINKVYMNNEDKLIYMKNKLKQILNKETCNLFLTLINLYIEAEKE